MYFVQRGPQTELMIDEKTQGFLKKVQNNDYELYVQRDGYWENVITVTQIFFQKRYKGLRRRAIFTVRIEKGDILLRDGRSLEGDTTVRYVLRNADKLLDYQPSDLEEEIFSDIKQALRKMVRRMEQGEFYGSRPDLEDQFEENIFNNEFGYELTVKTGQFIDELSRILQEAKNKVAAQALWDNYQLDLDQRRQLQQIQLDVQRLISVERVKLELEAEHIRRLKLIDEEMADKAQQRLFEKLSFILKLQPELVPAAILLAEPQAGSALAQIASAQAKQGQFLTLLDYLKPQTPRKLDDPSSPPLLPPDPQPRDPIVAQLSTISGVTDVEKLPDGYRIAFGSPPYYVEMKVQGNSVKGVRHGISKNPTRKWGKDLSGDIVTVARRVVADLQSKQGNR